MNECLCVVRVVYVVGMVFFFGPSMDRLACAHSYFVHSLVRSFVRSRKRCSNPAVFWLATIHAHIRMALEHYAADIMMILCVYMSCTLARKSAVKLKLLCYTRARDRFSVCVFACSMFYTTHGCIRPY